MRISALVVVDVSVKAVFFRLTVLRCVAALPHAPANWIARKLLVKAPLALGCRAVEEVPQRSDAILPCFARAGGSFKRF
jgi:hypothetical protein